MGVLSPVPQRAAEREQCLDTQNPSQHTMLQILSAILVQTYCRRLSQALRLSARLFRRPTQGNFAHRQAIDHPKHEQSQMDDNTPNFGQCARNGSELPSPPAHSSSEAQQTCQSQTPVLIQDAVVIEFFAGSGNLSKDFRSVGMQVTQDTAYKQGPQASQIVATA